MPINETYRTWIQRICELRPKQRKTQVQNFVWLVEAFPKRPIYCNSNPV